MIIFTQMLNPDKYTRAGIIAALQPLNVPVWAKKVPKNVSPVPNLYILISTQTKTRYEVSKDCWEWLQQTTLDITSVQPAGYSSTAALDDMEGYIITKIEEGINIPNFIVKDTRLVDSRPLDTETDTQSIERRILVYEFWLNRAE